MTDEPLARVPANPPTCPSCHSTRDVVLEQDAHDRDDRQAWRCDRCGVRWKVALTPRSER